MRAAHDAPGLDRRSQDFRRLVLLATAVAQVRIDFSTTRNGFHVGDTSDRSFRKYPYPSGALIYKRKDDDARWGYSGIAASPAPAAGVW
jgi:hypothetical protein